MNALDLWRPLAAPWKCRVNWEHVLGVCPVRHYVLLLAACGSPWGWNGPNSSCMPWLDLQKLFGSDLTEVFLWRRWPVPIGLPPFSLPVLKLEVLVRKPSLNFHHSRLPFLQECWYLSPLSHCLKAAPYISMTKETRGRGKMPRSEGYYTALSSA